jgi:hypothetical protein
MLLVLLLLLRRHLGRLATRRSCFFFLCAMAGDQADGCWKRNASHTTE